MRYWAFGGKEPGFRAFVERISGFRGKGVKFSLANVSGFRGASGFRVFVGRETELSGCHGGS